jgi:hypothetical protein
MIVSLPVGTPLFSGYFGQAYLRRKLFCTMKGSASNEGRELQ